ncbi:MAG: hypothetical protein ABII88_08135 [Candidatus Omnitrophota bacterium]
MSRDAVSCFLNSGEFAEEITYITGAGASKIIKAVVVRYELAPAEENINRSLKKQAEVYIANDETSGVVTVNKKDDRITLKDTEGFDREARINDIVNRDDGMWYLMVGW